MPRRMSMQAELSSKNTKRSFWIVSVLFWLILLGVAFGRYTEFYVNFASLGQEVAVAKGFGLALTVGFPLMYITKLQCWAWLDFGWNKFGGTSMLDFTELHASLGIAMFVAATVHTIAHLVNAKGKVFVPGSAENELEGPGPLRTTITGLVLYSIFLLITVTSIRRVGGPTHYRPFLNTHNLHYLTVPVAIAHIPSRWYVYGPLLVIIVLHYITKRFKTHKHHLGESKRIGNVTHIIASSSRIGGNHAGIPGSYFKICIPAISKIEWHPFSLTSSDVGNRVEFLIKDSGWWTTELGALFDDETVDLTQIQLLIRGPYYAVAANGVSEKRPMMVAAGIGITPYLSLIHHLVFTHRVTVVRVNSLERQQSLVTDEDHQTNENDGVVRIDDSNRATLVWVVRDLALVQHFLSHLIALLEQYTSDNSPVHVQIWFTGGGDQTMNSIVGNVLYMAYCSEIAERTDCPFTVNIGRPDLNKVVRNAAPSAAFYCGPDRLRDALAEACGRQGVPLMAESFTNPWLGNLLRWMPWPKKKKPTVETNPNQSKPKPKAHSLPTVPSTRNTAQLDANNHEPAQTAPLLMRQQTKSVLQEPVSPQTSDALASFKVRFQSSLSDSQPMKPPTSTIRTTNSKDAANEPPTPPGPVVRGSSDKHTEEDDGVLCEIMPPLDSSFYPYPLDVVGTNKSQLDRPFMMSIDSNNNLPSLTTQLSSSTSVGQAARTTSI